MLTISISVEIIILQTNAHKLMGLKMDLHREVREMVKVDKCSAENMLTGITENWPLAFEIWFISAAVVLREREGVLGYEMYHERHECVKKWLNDFRYACQYVICNSLLKQERSISASSPCQGRQNNLN